MPTPIDTKNHPAVKALAAHQEQLGATNKAFARRYLRCSDATWSTLKSGTYPSENVEPWIERCVAALSQIEDEVQATPTSKLLELSDARAAITAVRRCANEERNRLVVYLGDTGAGKTKLVSLLREKHLSNIVALEATESWRDSYSSPVFALCEALNLPETPSSVREAEELAINALVESPRILVMDEGHHCGKPALNLLKLVLNRSRSRVVVLAMPQLWDQMQKKAWYEAAQLRNRTYAKVTVTQIGVDDAKLFLAAKLRDYATLDSAAAKEVVALARTAANKFGLYNTLQRICDEVAEEKVATSVDVVTAAINRVEALRS